MLPTCTSPSRPHVQEPEQNNQDHQLHKRLVDQRIHEEKRVSYDEDPPAALVEEGVVKFDRSLIHQVFLVVKSCLSVLQLVDVVKH